MGMCGGTASVLLYTQGRLSVMYVGCLWKFVAIPINAQCLGFQGYIALMPPLGVVVA